MPKTLDEALEEHTHDKTGHMNIKSRIVSVEKSIEEIGELLGKIYLLIEDWHEKTGGW